MRAVILPLAGVLALSVGGSALAANTCAPTKHRVVHRVASYHVPARHTRVLADEPKARTYTASEPRAYDVDRERDIRREVRYEREYIYEAPPPPPPPPVVVERYPVYPAPLVIGYGPRWGYGWGYHHGWRRWR